MRAIVAGLGLSLLAGAAFAQTTTTPPMPGVIQAPGSSQATPAAPGQPSDDGQGKHGLTAEGGPKPSEPQGTGAADAPGQYEGMIIETPKGTFLVREPNDAAEALDQQNRQGDAAPVDQPPAAAPPDGMMAPQGGPMPPQGMMRPRPRPPHPPMMMQTRAARFRIKVGDMYVGVTCGEDEPVRNCVDAIGALVDKMSAAQHH